MSLVVGLKHKKKVYVATDSLASLGQSMVRELPYGKFFLSPCKKYILGYVGYRRDSQILSCEYAWKGIKSVHDIPNVFKKVLMDHGRVKEMQYEDATVEVMNSTFLIGHKGMLYELDSDFALLDYSEPYNAIGNGKEMALGILKATEGLVSDPVERIELVMETVKHYVNGVGGEIYWDVLK
jgi:ATP-dependent protease HslVU (ClpYQ) peptidase subunit